jgi:hypothetical protein
MGLFTIGTDIRPLKCTASGIRLDIWQVKSGWIPDIKKKAELSGRISNASVFFSIKSEDAMLSF